MYSASQDYLGCEQNIRVAGVPSQAMGSDQDKSPTEARVLSRGRLVETSLQMI